MRWRLVLFARAPALGRGKRRLAQDVGETAALRFERQMVALLVRRLAHDPRWDFCISVTPDSICEAWRRRFAVATAAQGNGDLGERMRRAIAAAPSGPVVLIGSDIPAIRPGHIAAAFRLLGRHDLVFGPASDGGFWLVGARRRPRLPPLFAAVRWSTPHALADTLAALPGGASVGFVDTLDDVDDGAAYRRLAARRGF